MKRSGLGAAVYIYNALLIKPICCDARLIRNLFVPWYTLRAPEMANSYSTITNTILSSSCELVILYIYRTVRVRVHHASMHGATQRAYGPMEHRIHGCGYSATVSVGYTVMYIYVVLRPYERPYKTIIRKIIVLQLLCINNKGLLTKQLL